MSYSKPTISGFNATPPSDDGAQNAANRVDWAKHIDKIGTPLRTYADAINDAAEAAFILQDPLTTTGWTPDTFAGFSANPATTFRYKLVTNATFGSGVVTMRSGPIAYGTQNGAPITFSTLPVAIRPSEDRVASIPTLINTGTFGVLKALSLAVIKTTGFIEIWNPINVTEGGSTMPRFIQSANVSGRAFSFDTGANFSYEL